MTTEQWAFVADAIEVIIVFLLGMVAGAISCHFSSHVRCDHPTKHAADTRCGNKNRDAYMEVTRDQREQLSSDGVFDINGNLPFHPGYCHIHMKPDGTFVWRHRETFNTDAWYNEEEPITDTEAIAILNLQLKGLVR